MTRCIVVMGVSGCGKSSVGAALAQGVGGCFVDGDDLHPASNVAKMASGEPLTDADRMPWLALVGDALAAARGSAIVLGCSALKRAYREAIAAAAGKPVVFVHLRGAKAVIAARVAAREHFMPTSLLDSQFDTLEPPGPDEAAVDVDVDQPFDAVVAECLARVQQQQQQQQQQASSAL